MNTQQKLIGILELDLGLPNINNFSVIETPGHTIDHVILYDKDNKILFSGDTLFRLGCGRVFEGSYKQMFNSLEKIKKLPKNTKIYCGHEYTNNNGKFCIEIDKDNLNLKKGLKM